MELSIGDAASAVTLATAAALTLLEVSPIKINPWSAIGKIINRAVLDEQAKLKDEMTTKFDGLETKIEAVREQAEESDAKAARMRIQRFADEMYGDIRHSKEHFDLILMDITQYNNYCAKHPGFVNEKTKVAQEVITDAYEKCIRERSFRV